MKKIIYLLLKICVLALLVSCSKSDSNGLGNEVRIILEKAKDINTVWRDTALYPMVASSPAVTSDFNCFTVNITGDGIMADPKIAQDCTSPDNFNNHGKGILIMPFTKSTTVSVTVPIGSNRNFGVYGFYPALQECGGSGGSGGNPGGYFLGDKSADISDDMAITIPISFTTNADPKFVCSGGSYNEFGNGSYGNDSTSTSTTYVDSTNTTNAKLISPHRRIIGTSNGGQTFTLSAAPGSDFLVGDLVMWFVMAAKPSTQCSPSGHLPIGNFMSGTVTSVLGSTITIDHPIVPSGGSIASNSDLNAALSNATFCDIQIVRVAQFQDFNIGASHTLNVSAFTSAGDGGIVAFKVAGTLTFGSGSGIDVSGKGFSGGISNSSGNAGDSVSGLGTATTSANLNGGGGGAAAAIDGGGGGGSSAFNGAAGLNSGGAAGTSVCGSFQCLTMGGGGGGAGGSSGAGGTGGGLIFIWANNILGSGYLYADGTNAGGAGGGGAGGSISLRTKNQGGTIVINAKGGSSGNSYGGVGAGGNAGLQACAGSAVSGSLAAGTTGNTTGSGGGGSPYNNIGNQPFCN